MLYVLYGAIGAVLVIVLFASGFFLGMRAQKRLDEKNEAIRTSAETPEEKEIRKLKEDQQAFQIMMNYNQDVAYGRVSAADIAGKDGVN